MFSTSTTFEPERGHSKFSAYALLNHGGDVKAAARELAAQGYRLPRTGSAGPSHEALVATPVAEGLPADALCDALRAPSGVTVNRTDGLRFEMQDAWVLVRPSGTEPVIRVTAEAAGAGSAGVLARRAEDLMSSLVAEAAKAAAHGGAC